MLRDALVSADDAVKERALARGVSNIASGNVQLLTERCILFYEKGMQAVVDTLTAAAKPARARKSKKLVNLALAGEDLAEAGALLRNLDLVSSDEELELIC